MQTTDAKDSVFPKLKCMHADCMAHKATGFMGIGRMSDFSHVGEMEPSPKRSSPPALCHKCTEFHSATP